VARNLAGSLAVALLALRPAFAQTQQKLAVLEFEVQKGLEIDRRTFSGRVQNAARRAAPNLFVMTQANIETLVRAAGKSLEQCEAQCAVDTGRLIGADIVISGRIPRVGRTYAIWMQMYETASGELKGGEEVSARTEDELLAASESAAERLLAPLTGGVAASMPTAPAVPGKAQQGAIKILSSPPGAKVSIDGDAVGATPLTVKRDAGSYVVSIEMAGYAPVSRQVELAAGKSAVINETLMQAAGYIEVNVAPGAAARAASVTVTASWPASASRARTKSASTQCARKRRAIARRNSTPTWTTAAPRRSRSRWRRFLAGWSSVSTSPRIAARYGERARQPRRRDAAGDAAGERACDVQRGGYEDASADVEVGPGRARAVKLTLKRVSAEATGRGEIELKSGLRLVSVPAEPFSFKRASGVGEGVQAGSDRRDGRWLRKVRERWGLHRDEYGRRLQLEDGPQLFLCMRQACDACILHVKTGNPQT
jgi:hypothetical protein